MRVNNIHKISRNLKPDLIPPRDARPVGLHTDGRMIYEAERRDHEATKKNKVQVIGPDGEPLFRKDSTGSLYPVMRVKPVTVTKRFVLERSPSGKVSEVYHFEPSKEEKERDEQKRMRKQFNDLLASEATKRGMTAQDLISRMLDPIREAGPGQALVEEDYPIHRGGGHWILSDGETFRGKREGAERAESMVSGKTFAEPEVEVEPVFDEPETLTEAH